MAFNYSISWKGFARILLPKNKRKERIIAMTNVMISPLEYIYDHWFNYFFVTASYVDYVNATPYTPGDIVRYGFGVYENIAASTGKKPYAAAYWRELQPNWIGATGRSKVKGSMIGLEYYLNTFYDTAFNWPSSQSDIYLETNVVKTNQFTITDRRSILSASRITSTSENSVYFFSDSFTTVLDSGFTIYVPTATWNALGSTDAAREAAVKGLIGKYIPAGLDYEVTNY